MDRLRAGLSSSLRIWLLSKAWVQTRQGRPGASICTRPVMWVIAPALTVMLTPMSIVGTGNW
ncbi:hypothetical protein CCGE525_37755 (plasmid) [Rhizobium jaguaris]|uniref:Uncharacterized protein n=1 Tax=Rhizobium jaguaris TaxID=1312183 RepID=A0A387G9H3_9HYPH|nr:hypothetical protein CCGE525_37755 [Rhizobium jaguaris]